MSKASTNPIRGAKPRPWKLSLEEKIKFPQLPDASPDPILITDSKANIYYANPAWEKLTGYKFKEVAGQNPRILNSGKTPKSIYKKLWRALSIGKSFSSDDICDRRKDGTEYQIHSTFFPIRKGNKNLFYVQIQHDITKHKTFERALQESEEKYHMLLEYASDAILIHDNNQKIINANIAACKLFGYTKEELLQKYAYELIKNEDTKLTQRVLKKVKTGQSVIVEMEMIRKDGSTVSIEASLKIITPNLIQSIIRDISERKELERQKDAFIGIASHELKTPITVLSGYTQILEKRLQNDKQNQYFLTNIKTQTNRLVGLIDDLLNVSKIDSGNLELNHTKFDLQSLIKKVVVDFQFTSETHAISYKDNVKAKVIGDEHRIEQVLINLLTNAVKYSPNAKKVVVQHSVEQKKVIVSVEDFGLGIAKEEQQNLFQRFYRTRDKEVRGISGFGLGLYIVSEIIKKHKGKVWVKSEKGKGSTFYFSLPLAKN